MILTKIFQLQILNYILVIINSQQYLSQKSSKCAENAKIDHFLMLSELAEKEEKVICVEFYESDLERVWKDVQGRIMGKLRIENQVKLEKPIEENSAIYIAFRIKDPSKTSTIIIGIPNTFDRYLAKLEIFADFKIKLSTHIDMIVQPVSSQIDASNNFLQFQLRFVDGRVKLTHIHNEKEPELIAEISVSLKSKFQSDVVIFENLLVFDMVYHENCALKKTFQINKSIKRETPKAARDFERSIIENFSPWIGQTSVKHLNLTKKNAWVENFMFHVFGHLDLEDLDFELQYKSGDQIALSYELKNNSLVVGKLSKYWHEWSSSPITINSQTLLNSYKNEDPIKIWKFTGGLTLNFFPKPEDEYVQASQLEITQNQLVLKHENWEPCSGVESCWYYTDQIEITSENSSISGFRFMNGTDYLVQFCFLMAPESIYQETLPFIKNCAAIENSWNFCSSSPDVSATQISKNLTKSAENIRANSALPRSTTQTPKRVVLSKKEHTISEIIGANPGIIGVMGLFFMGGAILLIGNGVIVILFDWLNKWN
ncbi:unnamed protein product [Caenorhabditis angaria]|uniref:Uncharacterized protein n=1 Tax=Caenorhabditis angaria TaxID=860376 RepID=A0A9P1I5B2_9PELO|nr:unnamed protein product [Caenorhabditis angaria]